MDRSWVYQRILTDVALNLLITQRVYQSTRLNAAPHLKPFILYRSSSDIEVIRGDDGDVCRAQGFMIFAHDIPGDYTQTDVMIGHLQRLFKDTTDQANGVVRSRWVETSEDFRDDDMGTIVRYARIQVTYRV